MSTTLFQPIDSIPRRPAPLTLQDPVFDSSKDKMLLLMNQIPSPLPPIPADSQNYSFSNNRRSRASVIFDPSYTSASIHFQDVNAFIPVSPVSPVSYVSPVNSVNSVNSGTSVNSINSFNPTTSTIPTTIPTSTSQLEKSTPPLLPPSTLSALSISNPSFASIPEDQLSLIMGLLLQGLYGDFRSWNTIPPNHWNSHFVRGSIDKIAVNAEKSWKNNKGISPEIALKRFHQLATNYL